MTEKLKNCPFCGSKDIEYFNGWKFGDKEKDGGNFRSPSVCCGGCGISISSGSYGKGISDEYAKKDTIGKWNKRIND